MARYFFDLFNGEGPVPDEQGQDMPDRASISREVSRIITDIAREELPGGDDGTISIRVRDERGRSIFTASLSFKTSWQDEADV